jgi:oligosaccharide repeat unit polymerase
MQHSKRFLRPLVPIGWACIAVLTFWEIQMRVSDAALALTAGTLLLLSLASSRYALGLNFTAGPMLYLALLGLFHLGLVVPWALGIYNVAQIPWFRPHGMSHALTLIIYSILSFQFGLFLAFNTYKQARSFNKEDLDESNLENTKVFAAGCLLFLAATIMFVAGLMQLDPVGYYRTTYSEIYRRQAESAPRFFGSGMTISFIGLYLAAAGASRRQLQTALLATGLWVSMLFYIGYRGPALIAGLIVYVVGLKKRVRFPGWFPWAVTAFLLVAVPVESVVREEPLNERSFIRSFSGINILDAPAEMGSSIRPLIETVDLIGPGQYRHGGTYLLGLKGILPNLSPRWRPGIQEQSVDDLPPSYWITAVVEPWIYKNYGGLGFSAVAEPYMNFGTPGVVIFFLLLAFLLIQLERISIRSSYALAGWALILGSLLYTTRNDFSSFFRTTAWGFLYLGAIHLLTAGKNSASRIGRGKEVEAMERAGLPASRAMIVGSGNDSGTQP